jgi:hypothetical protein
MYQGLIKIVVLLPIAEALTHEKSRAAESFARVDVCCVSRGGWQHHRVKASYDGSSSCSPATLAVTCPAAAHCRGRAQFAACARHGLMRARSALITRALHAAAWSPPPWQRRQQAAATGSGAAAGCHWQRPSTPRGEQLICNAGSDARGQRPCIRKTLRPLSHRHTSASQPGRPQRPDDLAMDQGPGSQTWACGANSPAWRGYGPMPLPSQPLDPALVRARLVRVAMRPGQSLNYYWLIAIQAPTHRQHRQHGRHRRPADSHTLKMADQKLTCGFLGMGIMGVSRRTTTTCTGSCSDGRSPAPAAACRWPWRAT